MMTTDKRIKRALLFVLTVAFVGVVLLAAGKQSQTAPNPGEQSTPLIQSVKGPDLFRAYCASCHGLDAKGAGPAASALKAKLPDLTLLSRKNQGRFPAARTRAVITGEQAVAAHGSREMPIWGPIIHQVEGEMRTGEM